jgi:hypothetical protein
VSEPSPTVPLWNNPARPTQATTTSLSCAARTASGIKAVLCETGDCCIGFPPLSPGKTGAPAMRFSMM